MKVDPRRARASALCVAGVAGRSFGEACAVEVRLAVAPHAPILHANHERFANPDRADFCYPSV